MIWIHYFDPILDFWTAVPCDNEDQAKALAEGLYNQGFLPVHVVKCTMLAGWHGKGVPDPPTAS